MLRLLKHDTILQAMEVVDDGPGDYNGSCSLLPVVLQCPFSDLLMGFREEKYILRKMHALKLFYNLNVNAFRLSGKVPAITYGHPSLTLMHIRSFVMECTLRSRLNITDIMVV